MLSSPKAPVAQSTLNATEHKAPKRHTRVRSGNRRVVVNIVFKKGDLRESSRLVAQRALGLLVAIRRQTSAFCPD